MSFLLYPYIPTVSCTRPNVRSVSECIDSAFVAVNTPVPGWDGVHYRTRTDIGEMMASASDIVCLLIANARDKIGAKGPAWRGLLRNGGAGLDPGDAKGSCSWLLGSDQEIACDEDLAACMLMWKRLTKVLVGGASRSTASTHPHWVFEATTTFSTNVRKEGTHKLSEHHRIALSVTRLATIPPAKSGDDVFAVHR